MDSMEGNMAVSKETLTRMVEEMNLIPLSDKELDMILPEVQDLITTMSELSDVDVAEARISHVFRADPTT
jgi:Asp-tRNA(Asn)/Glu-tRNA(Gln) amidotransferase C subunit